MGAFDFSSKAYNQYNELPIEWKFPIRSVMLALKKLATCEFDDNVDVDALETLQMFSRDTLKMQYFLEGAPDLTAEIVSAKDAWSKKVRAVKEPINWKYDEGKINADEIRLVSNLQTACLVVNPYSIGATYGSVKHFLKLYKSRLEPESVTLITSRILKAEDYVNKLLGFVGLDSKKLKGKHMDCNLLEDIGLAWHKVIVVGHTLTEEEKAYWCSKIKGNKNVKFDTVGLNTLQSRAMKIVEKMEGIL